jgi:hypothetical protein
MISSTKRVHNDMHSIEEENLTIIPPEDYYALKIKFYESEKLDRSISEKLLNETPKPLVVYYSHDFMLVLFSSMKESLRHQLNGNHNLIVSKYARFFAQNCPTAKDISIEIVHLHSRTIIFTYLSWIIFQTFQNNLVRLSKGHITPKDLQFLTEKELKTKFSECNNSKWDNLEPHEKYGTVLHMKQIKKTTEYFGLSELFDARDTKKYTSFIFGKN